MKIFFTLLFISFSCCGCWTNTNNSNISQTTHKRCRNCEGEGYIYTSCDQCNGDGYEIIPCGYCDGQGGKWQITQTQQKINCSTCGGTGNKTCSICSGVGHTECSNCGGNGNQTCALCKGKGVSYIFGDARICPRCNGNRYEKCYVCKGSGYELCSKFTACRECYGTGVIGSEPIVQKNYKTCVHCNGSRNQKIRCRQCGGTAHIRVICLHCEGTGKISN